MLKKTINWFTLKFTLFSLAFVNVEKNMLGQVQEGLSKEITAEARHTQGQLMDSLINGVVTEEVKNLRWRTYKINRVADGVKSTIVDYDEDNMPIVLTKKTNKKAGLGNIKLDTFDNYPLEMVVDNTPIALSGNQIFANKNLEIYDKSIETLTEGGKITTHGEFKSDDFFATTKADRPIKIGRDGVYKFNIEDYTKKLNIRVISPIERLLEFYVSIYPDTDSRKTRLFISNIKKAMVNLMSSTFLDIKEVSFVSDNTVGVDNLLEYKYEIIKVDKIIEFNGHYVIKYVAKVITNGDNITDKYIMKDLDTKYENKEKKKKR